MNTCRLARVKKDSGDRLRYSSKKLYTIKNKLFPHIEEERWSNGK